jgi:hypothetical protein
MVDAAGGSLNETMTFYEYQGKPGAHLSLNHFLADIKEGCDALCIQNLVQVRWTSGSELCL